MVSSPSEGVFTRFISATGYYAGKVVGSIPSPLREAGYIAAASEFIHRAALQTQGLLGTQFQDAYSSMVWAPIHEEVVFRLLYQGGIEKIQHYGYRLIRGREATKDEKKTQAIFRIFIVAPLFVATHSFKNPSALLNAYSITHLVTGALALGILKEATGSIGPTMLFHSATNFLSSLGNAKHLSLSLPCSQ